MAAVLVVTPTKTGPGSPTRGGAPTITARCRRNAVPDLLEQIDETTRQRLCELCRVCFENISDDSDPEDLLDTFARNTVASRRRNAVANLLDVLNEDSVRTLLSEYTATENADEQAPTANP